mgnify:CR=1 FL=1
MIPLQESRQYIKELAEFDILLNRAKKIRKTSATNCNQDSSRSHLIFNIFIEGQKHESKEVNKTILTMVDLAGSERVKESGVTG